MVEDLGVWVSWTLQGALVFRVWGLGVGGGYWGENMYEYVTYL